MNGKGVLQTCFQGTERESISIQPSSMKFVFSNPSLKTSHLTLPLHYIVIEEVKKATATLKSGKSFRG